jgi:hypothetical protein
MISIVYLLGFLMEVQRGTKGKEELIDSCVHLESLRESMSMRFQALFEASLGTSIHGDSQQAWGLSYLVERFFLGEGCIIIREDFQSSYCSEVCFRGRLLISIKVLWRGFFIRASSWLLAPV